MDGRSPAAARVRPASAVVAACVAVAFLTACYSGSADAENGVEGAGVADGAPTALAPLADADQPRQVRLERLLGALAADSMEGRAAGTEGERRARNLLAAELERYGVRPAGEDGYLQRVPLVRVLTAQGRPRWTLAGDEARPDTLPLESRREAWNVLGLIPGADPELAHEVVIVGAHYDHVGIGPADEAGDSIYNGADDDGSGTVAALEVARALVRGDPPGRSVLVALFSAEEMGLLGPRYWLEHPTVALDRLVADLQIEMIGRPDSLAGGPGGGWLTGYELSTLGDQLAAAGSPIVPDARPQQRFFFRSDNLPFARRGIPAHTLSSYNMHAEYHTPDDEVERVDFEHMAALVDAAEAMVRELAAGPPPSWHPNRDDVAALGLRGPFPLTCPDGEAGSALFVEGPPSGVWVRLADGQRHMGQVEAAAGAHYQGDGLRLELEGEEVRVQREGRATLTCRLGEPGAPPAG
jgi:hypothetical protein